jgi:hypothetical protein
MPTTESGAFSWIVAEKISDAAESADWPYSVNRLAADYPLDGLASAGPE